MYVRVSHAVFLLSEIVNYVCQLLKISEMQLRL